MAIWCVKCGVRMRVKKVELVKDPDPRLWYRVYYMECPKCGEVYEVVER